MTGTHDSPAYHKRTDRREFLRLVGAGGAAGLLGAGRRVLAKGPAAARRPNVVLIISDDQAWTDHGFMGHPTIRTPNLDRLASQSLVLTRAYVPTALCRPSLATLSTGLYPHQHRIVGNDPRGGSRNLAARTKMIERFKESPSLAGTLAKAGYVSFQSGKWWEGHHRNGGFTDGMTHGDPKRGGRHGDAGLAIGRKGLKPITDFLDRSRAKPFFIWYAPFLPHAPHNPPQRLLKKYTSADRPAAVARYFAMCEWFDETCGQLLDALDKRGLTDNTLVAYVCDNGWIQWTGRRPSFDALRGKRTPYEGGVRTPIMLRWPGRIKPRRDEKTLASSIDIVPTILAACGLDVPAELPGVDLLDATALAKRKAIFGAAFAHDVADINDPVKSLHTRWCIEGQWKLLIHHAPEGRKRRIELYDVLADPHEKADLAAKQLDRVKHLRKLIDGWWPISAGQ
jgi:arylsulfatase A-like enzyme